MPGSRRPWAGSTRNWPAERTVPPGLPVRPPPAGSLGRWSQATSCLSLQEMGPHYEKLQAQPRILTITWPEELATFLFRLLKCFNDKDFVQFPDVDEVWSPMLIYSPRNVHPTSHTGVSPLSNGERPMCVACTSCEISPKLA